MFAFTNKSEHYESKSCDQLKPEGLDLQIDITQAALISTMRKAVRPIELVRRIIRYTHGRAAKSRCIPFIERKPYFETRVDNKSRWMFMQDHIPEKGTCIDLGCAEGYFTAKAADKGLLTLGIDVNEDRLSYAQRRWGFRRNIGFANWEISPNNVKTLPSADVILFLTVYHHFVEHFGEKSARMMLQTIAKRANTVICEMPGDRCAGRYLTATAKNIETNEEYEFELSGTGGTHIRPKFYRRHQLPSGTYNVSIHGQQLSLSDPIQIEIDDDHTIVGDRPRIEVNNEEIILRPGTDDNLGIDDVIEWYDDILLETLGNNAEIIDSILTERKGKQTKRKDIVYIIDTSDVA